MEQLQLDRVEAYIHPENQSSLAIAIALGLSVVGEKLIHAPARARDELRLRLVLG
jgi:RimJ/RimL family protein N-acetyltransferase